MKKLKRLSIVLAVAFLASSIKCLGMPYGQGSNPVFECPDDYDYYSDDEQVEASTSATPTFTLTTNPTTSAPGAFMWTPEINEWVLKTFHPILPRASRRINPAKWWMTRKDGEILLQNAVLGPNGKIILNSAYCAEKVLSGINPGSNDSRRGGKEDTAISPGVVGMLICAWNEFSQRTSPLYTPQKSLLAENITLNHSMYLALRSTIWDDYCSSLRKVYSSERCSSLLSERFLPERLRWWFVQGFNAGRYSLGHLVMALCNLKPETPEQQPEIEHNVYVLVLLAQKMFSQ